jgi:hypothetical protein
VAELVERRLDAVSPDTRAFLEAAAVLGGRMSVGAAAGLAGTREPLAAVDEAIEAGLLIWDADEEPEFADGSVRDAVRAQIGAERRDALRAAAERLRGLGAERVLGTTPSGSRRATARRGDPRPRTPRPR